MATSLLAGSLILALASPAPTAPSAPRSAACSLLTASDIQAATGAAPDGDPHPAEMSLPSNKEPMRMCTWVVRAHKGQVVVSSTRLAPGENVMAYAKNNAGIDALRARKWKEESKDFGNAWCAVMTPPPGTKEPLMMASCTAGPKGRALSVVFTSPTRKLTIDQIKSLMDKAAARLP